MVAKVVTRATVRVVTRRVAVAIMAVVAVVRAGSGEGDNGEGGCESGGEEDGGGNSGGGGGGEGSGKGDDGEGGGEGSGGEGDGGEADGKGGGAVLWTDDEFLDGHFARDFLWRTHVLQKHETALARRIDAKTRSRRMGPIWCLGVGFSVAGLLDCCVSEAPCPPRRPDERAQCAGGY